MPDPKLQALDMRNVAAARQRQGSRGRKLDDKQRNRNIAPFIAKDRLDRQIQLAWLRDPGDADIIGIDTVSKARPGRRPPAPRPPESGRPPEPPASMPPAADAFKGDVPYTIIGGDASKRKSLDQVIRNNFSAREIAQMDGVVIELGRGGAGRGVAGYYVYKADSPAATKVVSAKARKLDARHYIKIGRGHHSDDVVTHELIHHLRARRLERGGVASQVTQRAAPGPFGDNDLEEAATDLESVSRHNPFSREDGKLGRPGLVGYYNAVVNTRGLPFDQARDKVDTAQLEDRAIITLSPRHTAGTVKKAKDKAAERDEDLRGSGLQNQKVVDRIEARFVDTNIARMGGATKAAGRISGAAENVDQYFAIVNSDGTAQSRIHYRTDRSREDLTDDATEAIGGELQPGQALVEMHDGKARRLRGSSKAVERFQTAQAALERAQTSSKPSLRFGTRQGAMAFKRKRSRRRPRLVKSRREIA